MEIVVFIGCNKSGTSRDAMKASSEMGYETVLLTNKLEFIKQREEFSEVHNMIYIENLFDKEMVFTVLKQFKEMGKEVKAVLSLIDPFVSYAATIAKERGLVSLSVSSLKKMENKSFIREQLKHLSVSPLFFIDELKTPAAELIHKYEKYLPLIIKPPISNGSKDVLLVKTIDELQKALHFFKNKFPNSPVLLEEYMEGTQYVVEVLVHHGRIYIAAVVEQEIMHDERFIITGYIYPAVLTLQTNKKLELALITILQELHFVNGNCHFEMRLIKGEWKLIEVNPRMSGGAMNRIILEGSGVNLAKEIIKLYLGEAPSLEEKKCMHVYTKFITVNSRGRLIKVTGKNRALAHNGVKEVYIKPKKGSLLTKPYSLGNRYAYVLASAESAEGAKKIALNAAKEIKFYLDPL